MIVTITPNPAIDITYHVTRARWGEVNRVATVREAPGGKGVNVARVLHQLGEAVTCTGFLGGDTGERICALLAGVGQRWVRVPGSTRRTVAIVDEHGATLFNEPGPAVPGPSWRELRSVVVGLVGAGDVVVVSGSWPAGTSPETMADLIRAAGGQGASVIVDTSGPMLLAAARAGAALLKPNHEELLEATGAPDVRTGAEILLEEGARGVVVSLGEEGVFALAQRDAGPIHGWRARPGQVLTGNPTGAGDAVVAALARALHQPDATVVTVIEKYLADAVALSGAAVLAPVAGEVDLEAYRSMRATARVETVDASGAV